MANIIPDSFKSELLSGTHNFANGGDGFKIALYTSNPYSTSSTVALTTTTKISSQPLVAQPYLGSAYSTHRFE